MTVSSTFEYSIDIAVEWSVIGTGVQKTIPAFLVVIAGTIGLSIAA